MYEICCMGVKAKTKPSCWYLKNNCMARSIVKVTCYINHKYNDNEIVIYFLFIDEAGNLAKLCKQLENSAKCNVLKHFFYRLNQFISLF